MDENRTRALRRIRKVEGDTRTQAVEPEQEQNDWVVRKDFDAVMLMVLGASRSF